MPAKKNYMSKAKISKISATSRASIKIRDNFFTLEYSEERIIPDLEDVNIDKERQILWDTVNAECDNQVAELDQYFNKKSKK